MAEKIENLTTVAKIVPQPPPAGYAVGIGLTNECDLSCAHCYRSQLKLDRLSLEDVRQICGAVPVGSVSLGVGENGLHPQYHEILAWLHEQNIRVAITSNGYSVEVLSDEELSRLHSVEFSLDYPTEAEQDAWRAPGNWRKCWDGIERCQRLGVRVAVIAVMMSTNYTRLSELAAITARQGLDLRFNIYQPVTGDRFSMSYEQFWEGILAVLANSAIVTISEPLVNALIKFSRPTAGSPCGKTSLRTLPDRRVSPCTYWPPMGGKNRLDLDKLFAEGPAILGERAFAEARHVPAECQGCAFVEKCGGGCASRRKLRGHLDRADEYCPIIRQDRAMLARIEELPWQAATFKDLPKAGNACTFVVKGRAPVAV